MKIPLKRKYLERKQSTGGKTTPTTSHSTKKLGLAALMQNDRARDLHFTECAIAGWTEQIPLVVRSKYKALAVKHLGDLTARAARATLQSGAATGG